MGKTMLETNLQRHYKHVVYREKKMNFTLTVIILI